MDGEANVKETKAPVKTAAKPEVAKPNADKPKAVKPKTAQPKAAKPESKESSSKAALPVKKTQEKTKAKVKDKKEKAEAKEKDKKEKVKKIRTLCKLVKRDDLKKHFKEFQQLVTDPLFICRKCGRVAKEKQYLCRPVLILMEAQEIESEIPQGKAPELTQENL